MKFIKAPYYKCDKCGSESWSVMIQEGDVCKVCKKGNWRECYFIKAESKSITEGSRMLNK